MSPSVAQAILKALPSAEFYFDWGGGLIWLSLDAGQAGADAGVAIVRGALKPAGGHATLIAAPEAIRASTPVFEPLEAAAAALTERVKRGFDPRGVLNPGRMYAGL